MFHNKVPKNNHANFGAPGSSVSNVAPGTGMLLLAMDNVEIFENEITDNNTAACRSSATCSPATRSTTRTTIRTPSTPTSTTTTSPAAASTRAAATARCWPTSLGKPFPEIFYDGVLNPKQHGRRQAAAGIRASASSATATSAFANIHFDELTPEKIAAARSQIDRDIAAYTGSYPRLPAITLPPHGPAGPSSDQSAAVYRSAPKKLSEYGFFKGNGATRSRWPASSRTTSTRPSSPTTRRSIASSAPAEPRLVRENDAFDFPVGSLVVKTFAIRTT